MRYIVVTDTGFCKKTKRYALAEHYRDFFRKNKITFAFAKYTDTAVDLLDYELYDRKDADSIEEQYRLCDVLCLAITLQDPFEIRDMLIDYM